MAPTLTSWARHLLTTQQNVLAVWQVPEMARSMRDAHRRGDWRRITRRVYAAGPAPPTPDQYLWAAALHYGPYSMLSGQAALVCHG